MQRVTDEFFQVERKTVKTSEGDVDLPILYYDVSFYMIFTPAPLEVANQMLAGTGCKSVPIWLNQTLAGLVFYEYHDTSVGIYNEVGLAVAAVEEERSNPLMPLAELLIPGNYRKLAMYVIDLPVTTPQANAAGREIWGYPKFVTDIPIRWGENRFSGEVKDSNGGSIVTMSGDIHKGFNLPAFDLTTLTNLNGKRVRTVVDVRGTIKYCLRPNVEVTVGSSSHPMADHIRQLEIGKHFPIISGYSRHNWQSRLNEGTFV
ncbi:MAG: hypothetical protein D6767_10230 [Candidatus Hydrogenedentota bacterium]|nr:MAG: hypothetical protein D6767_10230 [Candidatus Hydrogenedentota bacterium]